MTQHSETYNGWTNYPTWRVYLEMFDGHETGGMIETAEGLREMAEEYVEMTSTEGIARSYAMAFMSSVNWREIADHVNEANDLTEAEA
jgi:hypothetical protein